MRVLLVAPHSDLPDAEREVQHVANALDAHLLLGVVTVHDVLDELSTATYDAVWFACHGTEEGIGLSDGLLTASRLTQMLRSCKPALVVLNTCSSLRTAMEIHDSLQCAVVATITEVPDTSAYITATLLARGLASGLSIADAYAQAIPGSNREYVLLNGKLRLGNVDPVDDVKALLAYTIKRQDRILDDMSILRSEVRALLPRHKHMLMWWMGYAMLVVAVLLSILAERIGMHIPETAIIVGLLALMGGGMLWNGRGGMG